MSQRFLMFGLVAVVVCSTLAEGDQKKDPDDSEGRVELLSATLSPQRRLDGYQKWAMLTAGAVDASDGLFFRCLIPDREAWDRSHERQGPHWSPAIRVYANPIAKAAIEKNKLPFPEGSILVKEKLMKNKVEAITAMFREKEGFDRSEDRQNWRYFYVDNREEIQFGRIETCRKCHQRAQETDFAFLKYSDRRGDSSGP